MSLRQADVKKITRLTPVEIFQAHLQYFGPKPIGNLPMEGGTAVMPAQPEAPAQGTTGAAENWIYYGTPGVDDAWAPGSAVVASPGDVPARLGKTATIGRGARRHKIAAGADSRRLQVRASDPPWLNDRHSRSSSRPDASASWMTRADRQSPQGGL
jgi:hypothetical protein